MRIFCAAILLCISMPALASEFEFEGTSPDDTYSVSTAPLSDDYFVEVDLDQSVAAEHTALISSRSSGNGADVLIAESMDWDVDYQDEAVLLSKLFGSDETAGD